MKERGLPCKGEMVNAILAGKKDQTRRLASHFNNMHFPKFSVFGKGNDWPKLRVRNDISGFPDNPDMVVKAGNYPFLLSMQDLSVMAKTTYGYVKLADMDYTLISPYGEAGDKLWVREAWRTISNFDSMTPKEMAKSCLAAGYKEPWGPIKYECDGKKLNFENMDACDREVGRYRHARFMPKWASRLKLEIIEVRLERLNQISEQDALNEGFIKLNSGRVVLNQGDQYLGNYWHTAKAAFKDLWEILHGENSWKDNPVVWVIKFKREGD